MPFSSYLPEHMGAITLSPPGPFVAGAYAELILTYTAGTFGIDDTGMVKISWRTTSDMSKPQFDRPAAPNFTTVEASNGAKLEVWFDRLNIRPSANTLLIRVGRGYLRAGDTRTVRMGDRRQGSPGYRLQTNCEARVELRTSIDAFATYEFTELPEQPAFALVPGPVAHWKAIWPSLAVVGEPFRLAIVAEDAWGNPTSEAEQQLALLPSHPIRGLPQTIAIMRGDRNIFFRRDGRALRRSSHILVEGQTSSRAVYTADELFRALAGEDAVVIAHVGGRYADIKCAHDGRLERSVEVHSTWGTFE